MWDKDSIKCKMKDRSLVCILALEFPKGNATKCVLGPRESLQASWGPRHISKWGRGFWEAAKHRMEGKNMTKYPKSSEETFQFFEC